MARKSKATRPTRRKESKIPAAKDKPAAKAKKPAKKPAKKVGATKRAPVGRTVVSVEACKQCGAFKSRALKIEKAVGTKAAVEINKEKPGKGNFVVRVSGREEPVIELLAMKRPFPPLKALDMDEVCQQVVDAVGG